MDLYFERPYPGEQNVDASTDNVAVDNHVLQVDPDLPLLLALRQNHGYISIFIVEPCAAKPDLHANDK